MRRLEHIYSHFYSIIFIITYPILWKQWFFCIMKKDYNRYCHSLLKIEEVSLFTCICLSPLRTIQHHWSLRRQKVSLHENALSLMCRSYSNLYHVGEKSLICPMQIRQPRLSSISPQNSAFVIYVILSGLLQ